jgi:hypothetical protein
MAKKKVKKTGLHMEVNDIWGWVVLTLGILIIFSVAGWYYLTLV